MLTRSLAIALAGAVAMPALAGTQTWNFSGQSLQGSGYNNYIDMNSNGVGLNVTGWSDTGGPSYQATPETIESAEIRFYSGTLGLVNRDEDSGVPDHSIDSYDANSAGNDYDMILLEFSSAVSLTSFSIGWADENGGNYADISLLAYTGNSYSGISGETWTSLVNGGGWSVEDNFSNVPQSSTVNYQSAQDTYSNYWLIGAYNSVFGENWTTQNDGFKLAAVGTKTRTPPPPGNEVPEPGTLAMLASGLLALVSVRRKRAAA